jgi:5-methylcytosine-specific restriction endonuclease McrA
MFKPRLAELNTLRVQPMASSRTSDRRIRGTTLQNIRKTHFARFPLCVACQAKTPPRTTLAVELDHVVPLHQGGVESSDPFENRAGLCAECHLEKSKAEASAPRTPGGA